MRTSTFIPPGLASALSQSARELDVPGLAVALVAPGREALFLHGVAAPGGPAVNERTWFSVASTGKHVTAIAVLDLAQRGQISLTDPIGRYLPDVPDAWSGRQVLSLLQHRSGLAEYLSVNPEEPPPISRIGFMTRYAKMSPAFQEGNGWMYTNTNYILLGMLVAQVSGVSYAQALEDLLRRAGSTGIAVGGPAWARQANADASRAGTSDPDCSAREVIGDGDVCFTPTGAKRWLELLLDGGLLDPWHDRLMFSAGELATGRPSAYGCGWFVEPLGEATVAHHGGHFDGWTAMALINRSRGCGVFVMCNTAPGHTRAVRYLAQMALEGFAPGSTALSLPVMADLEPALTEQIRTQLLREPGTAPDPLCLANELRRVAEHANPARTVPNLFTGVSPQRFDLVQRRVQGTHTWHRYRLSYADRIEHVLAGTTPDGRLFWVWPL